MNDIVERLRAASLNHDELRFGWLAEAIDEIERLRAIKAHYLSVAAENRPSRALHEAALAEKDQEIERLRSQLGAANDYCYRVCGVCEFQYGIAAPRTPPLARPENSD